MINGRVIKPAFLITLLAIAILLAIVILPYSHAEEKDADDIICMNLEGQALNLLFADVNDENVTYAKSIAKDMIHNDCDNLPIGYFIYKYLKTGNEKYINLVFDLL